MIPAMDVRPKRLEIVMIPQSDDGLCCMQPFTQLHFFFFFSCSHSCMTSNLRCSPETTSCLLMGIYNNLPKSRGLSIH